MLAYLIGWLVLVVVFAVAQTRFYEAHRTAHGLWRPRGTPWMLSYSGDELRAMLRATFRADTTPAVERARQFYVLTLASALAYLVLGFPLAIWLLA